MLRGGVGLDGAYFGKFRRASDGRLLVATDRGAALWNGVTLERVEGSPDIFLNAVGWWGERMACGSYTGLWLRDPGGPWSSRGVLDGLPGVRVLALAPGLRGGLWVGTSRGLGWLPDDFDPPAPRRPRPRRRASEIVEAQDGGWLTCQRSGSGWRLEIGRALPDGGLVEIVDVRGRCVYRQRLARDHEGLVWDERGARGVASGVYFVRLTSRAGASSLGRFVLVR